MAGRPRTRRARAIAELVIVQLERGGVGCYRIDDLLTRALHGPRDWPQMAQWEKAATRMALRDLAADPRVVPIDGLVIWCPWNVDPQEHA
jgi:hypothetical protein